MFGENLGLVLASPGVLHLPPLCFRSMCRIRCGGPAEGGGVEGQLGGGGCWVLVGGDVLEQRQDFIGKEMKSKNYIR